MAAGPEGVGDEENPEWTMEQLQAAAEARRRRLGLEEPKERITIYLDKSVLEAFRAPGPGYQTRINEALRLYLQHGESEDTQTLIDRAIESLARLKARIK